LKKIPSFAVKFKGNKIGCYLTRKIPLSFSFPLDKFKRLWNAEVFFICTIVVMFWDGEDVKGFVSL